jgi:hypothetical protein
MNDDYHDHCVVSLAWHLERAHRYANELGLTRVVARFLIPSLRPCAGPLPAIPDKGEAHSLASA